MPRTPALALLACLLVALASATPDSTGAFNVRSFGATGDGKTLDTAAINQAIEAVGLKEVRSTDQPAPKKRAQKP